MPAGTVLIVVVTVLAALAVGGLWLWARP